MTLSFWSARSAGGAAVPAAGVDDAWLDEADHRTAAAASGLFSFDFGERAPVAVVGGPAQGGSLGDVVRWLRDSGVPVLQSRRLRSISAAQFARDAYSCLIVDIDSLGGLGEVVEDLLKVRAAHPGLPVIIISADFTHDEYGLHRLAICDVSLRAPVSLAHLDLALIEADINNMVWSDRCRQMDTAAEAPRATATWRTAPALAAGFAPADPDLPDDSGALDMASGWWIVPALLLGLASWAALFWSMTVFF